MANMSQDQESMEFAPCSFKFHDCIAQVGEVKVQCHFIKMEDCLYLWIGSLNNPTMSDLSFALVSRYEKLPVSTKILGVVADPISTNIAKRLTKRFGKPVYVSFNLQVDNLLLPVIESKIQEELKLHSNLITFN